MQQGQRAGRWTRFIFFALMALAGSAAAQTYPSRPVRILVPYPPGGPVDVFARGLGDRLGARWGQAVLIDNRPGALEIVAADATAKSAPDGHTLMLAADNTLSLNKFLFSKLPYDPEKDLLPVSRVVDVNMVLIVNGALPVNNLQEFIALMKKEGEKRNFGSAGLGNTTHLGFETLMRDAGFKMTHIPYKGIAPVITDMLAGQIDAMFAGVTAALPHMKSGKMKVLAISGPKRPRVLPEVPTFAEAGYPKVEARFYLSLVAPRDTPMAIARKVAADARQVMTDKVFLEKYVDFFGFEPAGTTPEEFAEFLLRDREIWGPRIRASGVKLD